MKKKILLVAGSLLAISNMIYAQDLSDDEVISLFRSNDYSKDDLTVNLRALRNLLRSIVVSLRAMSINLIASS